MSSVCPFCKAPVSVSVSEEHAPCPSCGQRAADHPSAQAMGGGRTIGSGWGDDDDDPLGGGLDLSRGGSMASDAGPSAYAGASVGFGDDDPFADEAPAGALELDLPPTHAASQRSVPATNQAAPPARPPVAPGAVPDLEFAPKPQPTATPAMPAVRPSGSMAAVQPPTAPAPGSNPALPVEPPSDPAMRVQSQPQMQPHAPAPAMPAAPPPPDPAAMIARFPVPPAGVWETPLYAMKVLWRQFELRQDLASLRKRRSPDVPLYERALKTHDEKTFALGLILTCAALTIASFIFFLPVILRILRAPD